MIKKLSLLLICQYLIVANAELRNYDSWQPVRGDYGWISGSDEYGLAPGYQTSNEDQCTLYKVGFNQELYYQYVQYKVNLPQLKEFTLCYWAKFNNHSSDHPIFSYAVDGQPKAIYSWIANSKRSSFFSMTIDGQTLYRLNYPLRTNKWYHTCQSWNGKTGEWQIWVNAERVGRGFNNRLVGHVIPHDGIAISGQAQRQSNGGYEDEEDAQKDGGGILGEITMLQLYNVALTAGKAHKDHKHHHAHQYDHDGNIITTTPKPTPSPRPALPSHPLLTAGQLNRNTRINFATGQQPQIIQGQNYNVGYANGQLIGSLVTQQLTKAQQAQQTPQQQVQAIAQQPQQDLLTQGFGLLNPQPIDLGNGGMISGGTSAVNPANVQYIDNTFIGHPLFKRAHSNEEESTETTKIEDQPQFGDKVSSSRKEKRGVFVGGGTIFDEVSAPNVGYQQSLLYGLAGIGDNQPILTQQKKSDEREPAEAEVKAVMNVCSGCDPEPFDKALVFGWRSVPKKLFAGVLYLPTKSRCRAF